MSVATVSKKENNKCWQGRGEAGTLVCRPWERRTVPPTVQDTSAVLPKNGKWKKCHSAQRAPRRVCAQSVEAAQAAGRGGSSAASGADKRQNVTQPHSGRTRAAPRDDTGRPPADEACRGDAGQQEGRQAVGGGRGPSPPSAGTLSLATGRASGHARPHGPKTTEPRAWRWPSACVMYVATVFRLNNKAKRIPCEDVRVK